MPLLEVEHVTTGYGRVEVLHDLSLGVPEGATVAVLGANGVGKTTLLKAISGTLPVWRGEVRLGGRRLNGRSAYEIATRGVTLIPEGRGIFPGLTVADNLAIGARAGRDSGPEEREQRLQRVRDTFPRLAERSNQQAGTLSGGEQQMLSMSRAFLSAPRLLLLDEISMGLAPLIVAELFDTVEQLKQEGQTIVLVEQYLTYALRVADICYVVNKGRVTFVGEPAELEGAEAITASFHA